MYLSSGRVLSLPQAHRGWILRDLAEYEAQVCRAAESERDETNPVRAIDPFLTQHGYRLNKRERSFKCRFPDGFARDPAGCLG